MGTDGDSSANESGSADHLLTTWGRYEEILGSHRKSGLVTSCRAKADKLFGSHVVDFIGSDKPWGSYGRVAIQLFRLETPCVYFIGGDAGAVKIGTTIAPLERLAAFQLGSPIKLSILALVAGGAKEEKAFHQRFAEHRTHGEWFARHPQLLEVIDDLFFPSTPHAGRLA